MNQQRHEVVFEQYTPNTIVFKPNWVICARGEMQLHFPISGEAIHAVGDVGGRILTSLNVGLSTEADNIGFVTIAASTLAVSLIIVTDEKRVRGVIEMTLHAICYGRLDRDAFVDVFEKTKAGLVRHGEMGYHPSQWS